MRGFRLPPEDIRPASASSAKYLHLTPPQRGSGKGTGVDCQTSWDWFSPSSATTSLATPPLSLSLLICEMEVPTPHKLEKGAGGNK